MSKVSKLVRTAREKLGLTQAQAAKKLGLSVAYYGLLDRGYPTYLSERVAVKLVKQLKVSPAISKARDHHNAAALKDQAHWRKVMSKKAS